MAHLDLSRRGEGIAGSPIIALENRRMDLQRAGRDIVNFAGGEMDLPTPHAIIKAGIDALETGYTRYTEDAGLLELREAVCEKLRRENGIHASPDTVIVTAGSKFATYMALHVLCDPGDEVLIPTPCWPTYAEQVRLVGASPALVPTREDHGFRLAPDALTAAVSRKTRGVILNNPVNPTGAVYGRKDLEALADVLVREELFVIVDEIYEHLAFDAPTHVSLASLGPDIAALAITVGGCSKNFSMTGWRVGFAAGPPRVITAMKRLQSQTTSCPNAAAQKAAVVALSAGPLPFLRDTLRGRRDALWAGLARLPGVTPLHPAAGFYVFAGVRPWLGHQTRTGQRLPADSASLASVLLEEASVAVLPGSAFGAEGYLRFTFAPTPRARIDEGLNRLRMFLAA